MKYCTIRSCLLQGDNASPALDNRSFVSSRLNSNATASASDILSGQTAYVDGEKVTGIMINRGQVTGSMSYANDVFAISQGYHDGTGSVTIDSAEQAKIIPENIKSGVRILGVDGSYSSGVDTSNDTVTAAVLLAGVTAHDANGNAITGTMTNQGSVTGSISTKDGSYIIPAGYHNGSGLIQISSSERDKIISENIKSGVEILGVTGSLEEQASVETPRAAALDPYVENLNRGWVGQANGIWTYESPTESYVDVYTVTANHQYFLTLGADVGTRFRVMFTTEDVSNMTEDVTGIAVNTKGYNDPVSYQNLSYTPEDDGYLLVQKDNVGNSNIKTYCYDTTAAWL